MQQYLFLIIVLVASFLSACGGQGGDGASSVAGYTPVTISLGGASVAGGAIAPAGTNPSTLGIVSMSVEARDAANLLLAGPVTGNAANSFTATLSVPNGSGITFTVRAFDGINTKIYQGLTAQQNLTGTAIKVPVTMQIWLGGVAAAGAPLTGTALTVTDVSAAPQSITLTTDATGQYQGSIPSNFVYPLLLKVTRPGLPPIFSMMTRTGRVNTTPLTTIATAQSLGASNSAAIANQFNATASAMGNAAMDSTVQNAASNLMQQLGLNAFSKLGAKNPMTDPNFVADGTGLDAVMDSLDLQERDEDGDGKPDLVLANRSPQATPVVSVKSLTPNVTTREPYSFAIPSAALAGDDIYGTPIALNEAVVMSQGMTPTTIPLGAGVGTALTAQDLNKLVGALIASAEESGINVSDVQNSVALGSFVGQTIKSIATSNGAAGGVSANTIQQAASATKSVMRQAAASGGKLPTTFNPTTASQQTSAAAAGSDSIPPVITPPADIYIEASAVQTPYSLILPTVFDNSPPVTLVNNAPVSYPLGVTVITWSATDAYGNTSAVTENLIVQDTTAPTIAISLPAVIIEATGLTTPYTFAIPTVRDNYGVASIIASNTGPFPVATTAFTWTATDLAGNRTTASQSITVQDTTAPSLIVPVNIYSAATATLTSIVIGSATATDWVNPAPTITNDAPAQFPVGITTVTWTADDGNGNRTVGFQQVVVTMTDTTPPSVTPPATITVIAPDVYGVANSHSAIQTFLNSAAATDNVGVVSIYNNAPAQFPLGRTAVMFAARDAAGNVGTATSFVDVYTYINGVLAAGRPVANGILTAHDIYGNTATATADLYGNYNLYSQLIPPLLLQVDRYGLPSLFSVTLDVGKAHVTTLTTMITARALQAANKAQIIANFSNSYGAALTPTDLYAATNQLKSLLGLTAFTKLGGKNPLNDPNFHADGTGMDAVMDALNLQERDQDGDGKKDLLLTNRSSNGNPVIKLLAANSTALLRDIYSFSLSGAALLGDDLYGTAFTENDVITSPYNGVPIITSGTVLPQTTLGYSREALNRIIPTILAGAEAQGVDLYASRTQLVTYVERVLANMRPAQNAGLAYDSQLQTKLIQNDRYAFVGRINSSGVLTNPALAADTLTIRSLGGSNIAPAFTAGNSYPLTVAMDSYANFTATAFDPEGGMLIYDIYTAASNGTVTINTTSGAVRYSGNLHYKGSDSFKLRVRDPYSASALLTVKVTVTPSAGYSYLEATHDPYGSGGTEFGYINFLNGSSPFQARYFSNPNVVPNTFAAIDVYATSGAIGSNIDAYSVIRLTSGGGLPGYQLYRSTDSQLMMGIHRSSSVPVTMRAVSNSTTPFAQVVDVYGSYFYMLYDYMTYSGSERGTIDIYANGGAAYSATLHRAGSATATAGSGAINYQIDSYGYLQSINPGANRISHTMMLSADRSVGVMDEMGSQIGFVIRKHSNVVFVNNRTLRYWIAYDTSPSVGVGGIVGAQAETGLIQFDANGQADFRTAISQMVQNNKSCGFGLAGSNACPADATAPLIRITSQGAGGDIYTQLIDSTTGSVTETGQGYISQSGSLIVIEWNTGWVMTLMDSGETIPTSYGIIEGFVSNSDGQAGPMRVMLYNNTGVVAIVPVDSTGHYRFNNVAPGSYGITSFVDANNDGSWQWQSEAASDARVPAGQASIQINITGSSVGQTGNVINGYSIAYGLDVVGMSSGIYGHVTNSSGVAGTVLVDSVLAATATADGQSPLDSYGNYALIGLGTADWYARAFVDVNGNKAWDSGEPVAVTGNIAVNSYGAGQQYLRDIVISAADTTPPSVTVPAIITVIAPDVYGVADSYSTIQTFLNGATATDNVGVVSTYNNAPVQFPLGRTAVVFSAVDAAGNVGTAISFVDVYTYINGVLAAGRPIANGTLIARDLYGATATATADLYGNYNLYSQLTPPLLLQVDRYGLPSLFSVTLDVGRAHVTTLTTMITARALQAANKAQIIANFSNPYGAALIPADLYAATSQLKSLLGLTAFTQLGGKNPLNDPNFHADGTGMDAVMDALDLQERDEDGDGKNDLILANRTANGNPVLKLLAANPLALLRDVYSFSLSGAALLGDDLYGTVLTENDVVTSPYNASPRITSVTTLPQTTLGYSREALNRIIPALLAGAEAQGIDLYASRSQLVTYVERVLANLQPVQNAGLNYDEQLQIKLIQNDRYAFTGVVDSYGVLTNPTLAADTLTTRSVGGALQLQFTDFFNTLDATRWQQVGGTWSVTSGVLNGAWSISAAQTDQGNLLLQPSVLAQGADFSASFNNVPASMYGERFILYNSAGNKYSVAFSSTSFNVQVRQNSGLYTSIIPQTTYAGQGANVDCSVQVCSLQIDKTGSLYVIKLNGSVIGSFTDTIWNGNTRLGLGAYGTANYDSFSLYTRSNSPPAFTAGTSYALTVAEDTYANFTATASDPEGGALTYDIYTAAANGTATVNASTGAVSYIGNLNYNGSDSFQVRVRDPYSASALLNVSVTVTPVNDAPVAGHSSTVPSQGLVAHYLFSGNANDVSGNAHNGTVVNATMAQDRFGSANTAYAFNGSNAKIELGSWFNYQSFSLSLWVNPGATQMTHADIVDNKHMSGLSWVIQQNVNATNQYLFGFYPGSQVNFTLAANQWQQITFVIDPTAQKRSVYVDGNLVQTVNVASLINYNGSQTLRLGGWGNSSGSDLRYWNGVMDDVVMYNRSLTASEVHDLYSSSSGKLNYTTSEDSALTLALSGADIDGNALTAKVATLPLNGSLYQTVDGYTQGVAITSPYTTVSDSYGRVIFVPTLHYTGGDSFQFVVNDGFVDSAPATVNITVTPAANVPPTAGLHTAQSALAFDGVNDSVTIPAIALAGSSFTVDFWVKRAGSGASASDIVLGQTAGAATDRVLHIGWTTTDQFRLGFWNDDLTTASAYPDVGVWHHWAVNYNATTRARLIYRDGQQVAADTSLAAYAGSGAITLGTMAVAGAGKMHATLDQLHLWNSVRTQAQIAADMYTTLRGNEANLIGSWSFNDGYGATAKDAAASANHGSLGGGVVANMPKWVSSGAFGASSPGTFTMPRDSYGTIYLGGSDANGDALTMTLSTLPAAGVLYQTVDGYTRSTAITNPYTQVTDNYARVIFAPVTGASGVNYAGFDFYAWDGLAASADARVTINVHTQLTLAHDPYVVPAVGSSPYAATIKAVLKNSSGLAISGATVWFSTTSATAALSVTSAVTDSYGSASITVTDATIENIQIDAYASGVATVLDTIGFISPTADADGDGLTNAQEFTYGTNPYKADTDGDGFTDLVEINAGTDPLLSSSRPVITVVPGFGALDSYAFTDGTLWQQGIPTSGPSSPWVSGTDTYVWATNLSGGYPNNARNQVLYLPLIDLTGATAPTLSMRLWSAVEAGPDGANLEAFIGGSWTIINPYVNVYTGSNAVAPANSAWGNLGSPSTGGSSYLFTAFDLKSYIGQQLQLRFTFASDGSLSGPGVYLDEIRVDEEASDPDGDGINGVITEWQVGSDPFMIDSDGDGTNDGADTAPLNPAVGFTGASVIVSGVGAMDAYAVTGGSLWQQGIPTSGPSSPWVSGTDTYVWATNLSGGYFSNARNQVLYLPLINLTGATAPTLSMRVWSDVEAGRDGASLEAFIGGSWTIINPYVNVYTGSNVVAPVNSAWGKLSAPATGGSSYLFTAFDLTSYTGQQLQLRFTFASDTSLNGAGVYLDEIRVDEEATDPDGDGISGVITEWQAGSDPFMIDSDGDGTNDGADTAPLNPAVGFTGASVIVSGVGAMDAYAVTDGSLWQQGIPTSGPSSPWVSGTDTYVWATNLSGGYPSNARNQVLYLPLINLTGATAPTLSMRLWSDVEAGRDGASLEAFIGGSWTIINPYVNVYTGSNVVAPANSAWGKLSAPATGGSSYLFTAFDLTSYTGQQLQLRFTFASDTSLNGAGVYVDEIRVDEEASDPDDDGITGVITEWNTAGHVGLDPFLADTDGDGVVDGSEVAMGTDPLNAASVNAQGAFSLSSDTGLSTADFYTNVATQTVTTILTIVPLASDTVYGSVDNGTTWVNVTAKVSGVTLTWSGVTLLNGSNTLKVKVVDSNGNLRVMFSHSYTVDNIAPTIVAHNPAANATGIATTAAIDVTFSEPVTGFTTTSFTTTSTGGGVGLAVNHNASNNESLSHNVLAYSTVYTVALTSAITDQSGNALAPSSWTFTTAAPPPSTVGGSVSGLASGESVVLQNNLADNYTASSNGAFTFATAIASGAAYSVTVLTSPAGKVCIARSGNGTITGAVTNVSVVCQPRQLNDTGITTWGNATVNNYAFVDPNYPGQDADFGRDAYASGVIVGGLTKVGASTNANQGFDFTKLDAAGKPLTNQTGTYTTTPWDCVQDNHTGLMWEVKTTTVGLRKSTNTYTWYNSTGVNDGGSVGTMNGGTCTGSGCDTEQYVAAINALTGTNRLCSYIDWRLPTLEELESIVNYNFFSPNVAIDTGYFPNTVANVYWSSTPSANGIANAGTIIFDAGADGAFNKSWSYSVRLVRGGK